MNHERISEAKCRVNLRLVLLLVFCTELHGTELHTAVSFFPTYTNSDDVYAINKLYSALGSPPLSGWTSVGGDPCYEQWQGVQCTGNSITAIVLSGTNLRGQLHDDSLANFTSILALDLSNNSIGGVIPQNLPSTLRTFSLSGNKLTGTIPSSLSYLTALSDLSLCSNRISGALPDAFKSLTQLVSLKVSDNKLTGHLPASMRYLTSLTTMHVQNNELSGTLDILQNLPLKDLNIANNHFSGQVPENLQKIPNFQSDGNQLNITISPSPELPPAANGPVQQNDPAPPVYNPPLYHKAKTTDMKVVLYAVVIGSSLIVAIAISLVTICIPTWKAKRNASLKRVEATRCGGSTKLPESSSSRWVQNNQEASGEVGEPKVNLTYLQSISANRILPNSDESQNIQKRLDNASSVKSFSVATLQQYTNSFSEENLINECSFGTFYLAEDEVKTMYTVLRLKIEESKINIPLGDFLRLVESLSKMVHPNILTLIGYCSEYGQRLLVYKHFSKTTLHDTIHSRDPLKRTVLPSWTSRIQIALEAAKALEYLHESGQNSTVHRQFASHNILLDDELRVQISCCGLAPSLPFISGLQSYSPLALSYNAPEVNESEKWSAKSDVYSFGVVLLEILTGHEPYDSSRPRAERHLVTWASFQLHDINALVKMVDPAIEGRFPIRSLSRVADIISRCTQEEPEFRPTMSEVVQDLTRALDANDVLSEIL